MAVVIGGLEIGACPKCGQKNPIIPFASVSGLCHSSLGSHRVGP